MHVYNPKAFLLALGMSQGQLKKNEYSLIGPCFSSTVTLGVLVPLQAWASLHIPGLLLTSPSQLLLLQRLQ